MKTLTMDIVTHQVLNCSNNIMEKKTSKVNSHGMIYIKVD